MSITFKQTNSNDLVEAVPASSTKKSGYEAFIASLNNLNSLPTNVKKKLATTSLIKTQKSSITTHNFNYLRQNLVNSFKHYKYPNHTILNLVDYLNCLEYLVHQIDPIDPIYDMPEVKQVYSELFKILNFNPEDLLIEFKKIQKQCKEILDLTIEYKLNIINNYHKIIIQNNIFYVNRELITQYGEKLIRNYYSQPDYLVSDLGVIPNILFHNQDLSLIKRFSPENLIKRNAKELSLDHKLATEPKRISQQLLSIEEIKSKLKDCMSLPTYRVSDSFFKYPHLEDIEASLFSNLIKINVLNTKFKSWTGLQQFSESIAKILTSILNEVKVSLISENIATKVTKLNLQYNQFNPFPTMEFERGCTFEKLIHEYEELNSGNNGIVNIDDVKLYDGLISNNRRGTFHQTIQQKITIPRLVPPFITEDNQNLRNSLFLEIERHYIYGTLEVPLPLLDFGELSGISTVINKVLELAAIEDEEMGKRIDDVIRYLYVKAEVVAYNTEISGGKHGFLCAVNLYSLYETLELLSGFSFITPLLYAQFKEIFQFFDKLKEENIFEIYCYKIPGTRIPNFPANFTINNLGRSTSILNPIHIHSKLDLLLYSSNMGELVLNYPKNSIKAFGNKSIKEQIYNEYKSLTDASEKDRFLNSLFKDIHIYLGKNGNVSYSSESLESKGFNVPLAYIALYYNGNRYKFLLSDFSIIFKKYQYIKYIPETNSRKKVKKPSLVALKTKFKSLVDIPGKCTKDDVLKYIDQVVDLKVIYNSGTNKFNKVVEVINESNSTRFKTDLKNLKIYVEESKPKRKASKN